MSNRTQRPKAQDVFNASNYVFSDKVSFEEAYPEIKDVEVRVEETGNGVHQSGELIFLKSQISAFVNCSNPLCYNGGVALHSIIRQMNQQRKTEDDTYKLCQGNEASPKGKRIYRKCMNMFHVKTRIQFKDSD